MSESEEKVQPFSSFSSFRRSHLNMFIYSFADMFPEPIEGTWIYYMNQTEKGQVCFCEDKIVESDWYKKHGTWEYDNEKGILIWDNQMTNERIHKFYFSHELNAAVLFEPRSNPPATMKKENNVKRKHKTVQSNHEMNSKFYV